MTTPHLNSLLHRRRTGAIALAVVGVLAIMRLRSSCEMPLSIGLELATQFAVLSTWLYFNRHPFSLPSQAKLLRSRVISFCLTLVLVPWFLQVLLRVLGHGTGLELIAMSSFAWATLFGALCAQRRRSLGTTVVCSGFLTLLATCSSDKAVALLLALIWGGLCLWWLASSHWERAQSCQVSIVVENRWQRPIIVLVGCCVFALSAWSVAGRFPPSQRLPWEIAPTSGGTSSNDSFARSGVGDGDALVAARENAASFGAVDSDLMLDSKEASLFDLYSDTFGEPVRKQDVERTVALNPQQQEAAQPTSMAQSDGASAALTTQRRAGNAVKPMANRASDALMFWIGRPDAHLALERFGNFDGIQWHPTKPSTGSAAQTTPSGAARTILPIPAGNLTWFAAGRPTEKNNQQPSIYTGSLAEAVKFARLRSPRIPVAAGMHSWHIKQVDDGSFFHVDENDNLSMPGRKSVPEFTIVRYINREIDLQSLTETICPSQKVTVEAGQASEEVKSGELPSDNLPTVGQALARRTLDDWLTAKRTSSAWDTITLVMENLRQRFRLDRTLDTSTSLDPLADFLKQGAGSDLMFATAAATMLRELGYETRLVTGFVARAENRLGWTKELAIYAGDTHAWLEVRAGNGQWVPLEPTPGYPLPTYRISWSYWFQLQAWTLAISLMSIAAVTGLAWWQRAFLFDCLCQVMSLVWWLGNDRQRCRWLLAILDFRSRLAGFARPAHVSPQRWYAALAESEGGSVATSVAQSTRVFFKEADCLWFGNQPTLSQAGRTACRTLWTKSTCCVMRSAMLTATNSPSATFRNQIVSH